MFGFIKKKKKEKEKEKEKEKRVKKYFLNQNGFPASLQSSFFLP